MNPSTSAARHKDPLAEAAPGPYIGPATVVDVSPDTMIVELPQGGCVRASMAMAIPYEARPGDLLLVAGSGEAHYVIGVLRGTGRVALRFNGDVDLHAVDGVLRLSGDRGVELRAPELDVVVDKVRAVATTVVQRFSTLCQRVTKLLDVHAGQAVTLVDESSITQAKQVSIVSKETVTLNGREIHLG